MLLTDVQRSVRLNKKEKSTNTSPYPDEVIDRLARAFYPAILACWNSEEGQREFAVWQAEQAHHTTSPTGDVSRDSKGAQHPWHTTLVQSLVCYTFPEVYTFLKCKKPHTQHLDGADMGLDASSA